MISDISNLYNITILPKGIKIAHLNVNHLNHLHFEELKLLIKNKPLGILTLTETWLNDSYSHDEFIINGFGFCRQDRIGAKKGGGIGISLSNSIAWKRLNDFVSDVQFLIIEILPLSALPFFI